MGGDGSDDADDGGDHNDVGDDDGDGDSHDDHFTCSKTLPHIWQQKNHTEQVISDQNVLRKKWIHYFLIQGHCPLLLLSMHLDKGQDLNPFLTS